MKVAVKTLAAGAMVAARERRAAVKGAIVEAGTVKEDAAVAVEEVAEVVAEAVL